MTLHGLRGAGIVGADTADMYSGGASEEITGRLLSQVALSDEESARLEAPYRPHPVIGHG
jgi:aryl-alcohol dehydrogenase-like predicted oxidoreductase